MIYVRQPVSQVIFFSTYSNFAQIHFSLDKDNGLVIIELSWAGTSWEEMVEISTVVPDMKLPETLQTELIAKPNPSHTMEFTVKIPKNYEISKTKKWETKNFIGVYVPFEDRIVHL